MKEYIKQLLEECYELLNETAIKFSRIKSDEFSIEYIEYKYIVPDNYIKIVGCGALSVICENEYTAEKIMKKYVYNRVNEFNERKNTKYTYPEIELREIGPKYGNRRISPKSIHVNQCSY